MRTLQPPESLEVFDVFVVIWEQGEDSYVLALPNGTSYDLGNGEEAMRYFRKIGMEEMGQRGIDCARNFFTSVVIWKEKRCYGAETKESRSEYQRLFKQDPEPLMIIG